MFKVERSEIPMICPQSDRDSMFKVERSEIPMICLQSDRDSMFKGVKGKVKVESERGTDPGPFQYPVANTEKRVSSIEKRVSSIEYREP